MDKALEVIQNPRKAEEHIHAGKMVRATNDWVVARYHVGTWSLFTWFWFQIINHNIEVPVAIAGSINVGSGTVKSMNQAVPPVFIDITGAETIP